MQLTTMTRNALGALIYGPEYDNRADQPITRQIVSELTHRDVQFAYSIGKKGCQDVVNWLAEEGLQLKAYQPKAPRVSQASIDAAIKLLERNGYKVTKA